MLTKDLVPLLKRIKLYYRVLYKLLCGCPPFVLPWHYQWLSTNGVSKKIIKQLSFFPAGATVLDVGCGGSPYKSFIPMGCKYVGLDIETTDSAADIIIEAEAPWPLNDNSYDCILCTQVLEHVHDTDFFLSEISRVLKPGGMIILSVPFIYGEHGRPWDYRRFTSRGINSLLSKDYDVISQDVSGGIGSVIVTILLNWIDDTLSLNRFIVLLKAPFLPIWILLSFAFNLFGILLDRLDYTKTLYLDNIVTAKKKVI
jgi:SAM-dependent methyltransferase